MKPFPLFLFFFFVTLSFSMKSWWTIFHNVRVSMKASFEVWNQNKKTGEGLGWKWWKALNNERVEVCPWEAEVFPQYEFPSPLCHFDVFCFLHLKFKFKISSFHFLNKKILIVFASQRTCRLICQGSKKSHLSLFISFGILVILARIIQSWNVEA